ncbi:MAG: gamma-glutamyltransferase [Burkholderiaceae bacterium]|nr:gamma-glutamyltransferase [Burkholderiaceae bacterium]
MSSLQALQQRILLSAALVGAFLTLGACGSTAPPSSQDLSAATEDTFLPPEGTSGFTEKKITYTNRDMVVAANPLAVQAGVEILKKGGSAVDAAIAVQAVLTLVEPQSSGLGGGAFMMHYDNANNQLIVFDGRETAPAQATPNMFLTPEGNPISFEKAVNGGLAVGTPGAVKMLEAAHKKYGKLAWETLFAPAIKLSREGFPISPRLFTLLQTNAPLRTQQPAAAYFYQADPNDPNKLVPRPVGSLLKNPQLAVSLELIAKGGAAAFYTGPLAQAIVEKVRNHPTNPGHLSMEDMANYQPKVRDAICGIYRIRFRICGLPMPSSGGTSVAMVLGILDQFDVAALKPNSVESVHLISEAYRLVYADRALYMADSDFVSVPVAGLLNPEYLKRRALLINPEKSMGVPVAGVPEGVSVFSGIDQSLSLPSTSHISIVDQDGNAVSMTTSIENVFGSLQMVGGFLLNNQLTDFSFKPVDSTGKAVANRLEPGKRPRSSMSPTIVFNENNQVEMIIGSPGGSNIIQYVVKTLVGVIDWKLNIQQAINLPNFGAQTSAVTSLERLTSAEGLENGLKAKGHTISIVDINSGLHGITFNGQRADGSVGAFAQAVDKKWAGGADPRREGIAAGND